MEEKKCAGPNCDECQRRAQEEKENDEMTFAVLLALVPMLTLTLFGSAGLI